jgi:hypothetical protein
VPLLLLLLLLDCCRSASTCLVVSLPMAPDNVGSSTMLTNNATSNSIELPL